VRYESGQHTLLQYGGHSACRVRGMATVYWKSGTEAGARAKRWLRSRSGLGRGGDCAWGQGLERDGVCARGQGVGRDGDCTRGQGIGRHFYSFLPLFFLLIWVSRSMMPNKSIKIHPIKRIRATPFLLINHNLSSKHLSMFILWSHGLEWMRLYFKLNHVVQNSNLLQDGLEQ